MKAIGTDKDGYRIIVEAPYGATKGQLIDVARKSIKKGEICIEYDDRDCPYGVAKKIYIIDEKGICPKDFTHAC